MCGNVLQKIFSSFGGFGDGKMKKDFEGKKIVEYQNPKNVFAQDSEN